MSDLTHELAVAKQLVMHAEASRYLTMAGFTILVWDHMSTFDDEVRYMWRAPRSLVKVLYFVNRYLTPSFLVVTVYQMSRLAVFSDTFCKWWMTLGGFVEISSLAISDLLLLYRLHALWGGRRSIVIATYALYFAVYSCITTVGLISAVQLVPHLHYSDIAKTCASDFKPKGMSIIWSFALCCEILVFILTATKAFHLRRNAQMRSPVVTSLYGGQFLYYLIIIVVRAFNLFIWGFLPPSLLWLGLFFIWALVTTLVSRIMLHLRRAACERNHSEATAFFGETFVPVQSTRVVWARRNNNNTTTMESSIHTISQAEVPVAEGREDGDGDWSRNPRGRDAAIELRKFKARASRLWP